MVPSPSPGWTNWVPWQLPGVCDFCDLLYRPDQLLQLYGWPGWPGGWGIGGAAGVSGPVVSAAGAVAVGRGPGGVSVLELGPCQNIHGRCGQYYPRGSGGHGPDDPAQQL
jgi:hypothetical protein